MWFGSQSGLDNPITHSLSIITLMTQSQSAFFAASVKQHKTPINRATQAISLFVSSGDIYLTLKTHFVFLPFSVS